MMTERDLEYVEPAIWNVMSDKHHVEALTMLAAEEKRLAEAEAVMHVRAGNDRLAQIAVGKVDGIELFLSALFKVAQGYQKRKTSASKP